MPKTFISPDGRLVDETEACPDGVMRDGFRIGFDMALMDTAPGGGRMYLVDSTAVNDAAIRDEVDRQRSEHVAKFAFMGFSAPAFDSARAEFLARSNAASTGDRAVRDAIRGSQHLSLPASSPAGRSAATHSNPPPTTDSRSIDDCGRAVVAAMRAAQYR